jgi:hypothetical protein
VSGRVGELEPEEDAVDDGEKTKEEEEGLPSEVRRMIDSVSDDSSLCRANKSASAAIKVDLLFAQSPSEC